MSGIIFLKCFLKCQSIAKWQELTQRWHTENHFISGCDFLYKRRNNSGCVLYHILISYIVWQKLETNQQGIPISYKKKRSKKIGNFFGNISLKKNFNRVKK